MFSGARRFGSIYWLMDVSERNWARPVCVAVEVEDGCKNVLFKDKQQVATYAILIQKCGRLRVLSEGRSVHGQIISSEHFDNVYLGNLLVQMYGKCGSVEDAERVFDSLRERNVFSWSIMLAAYAQNGYFVESLQTFWKMQLEGVEPSKVTFISLLDACASTGVLSQGKRIHSLIASIGLELDIPIATSIVNMYGKCGGLIGARRLFDRMEYRDAVCWNAMIATYAQNGHSLEALKLFCQMNLEGTKPNKSTFVGIIDACASLEELARGQQTHEQIVDSGFEEDGMLGNCLLNMYGKCGSLPNARIVFDRMSERNVVSWNTMIAAYARNGCGAEALQLVQKMCLDGVEPDKVTFLSILDACESIEAIKLIHARIVFVGLDSDVVLGTALVNMYGKCGSLDAARRTFDRMCRKDIVAWNAMISAYSQNGYGREAIQIFQEMDLLGVKPNRISLTSILDACDLGQGKLIHARIISAGFESELVVGTALVNMYTKCRSLEDASDMFEKMQEKDMLVWTAMVASNVGNGCGAEALQLFRKMELEGIKPNKVTLVSVLDACTLLAAAADACLDASLLGARIHKRIASFGLESDNIVANSLVNMYSKCKRPDDARCVFDKLQDRDVVSWNAIISGCAQNGRGKQALELYLCMSLEGMKPDTVTFLGILDACANLETLEEARFIHRQIVEGGFETIDVVGTTLINIYGKSGNISDAESVFEKLDKRDVVSWNAMVATYVQNENGKKALKLLKEMDVEGAKPDRVTFITILDACAGLADLAQAKVAHARVVAAGFESDATMGNTLVSMYGKCGSLDHVKKAFSNMHDKNVISWNALIVAYARNGYICDTIDLFCEMDLEGVKPNDVSFISILFACNHAGLLDEGARYFAYMTQDHSIVATADHYSCLIGLLGRAGWTKEAEELINNMPFPAGAVEWMALLGGCTLHENNVEIGERAAERVLELDPNNGAPYIMLSNIYVAASRWDDVARLRKLMEERNIADLC